MDNDLNPEIIYNKCIKNEISKKEASKLLESVLNESDNEKSRATAIEFIIKISIINSRTIKIIEKSLISDESALVRASAAKLILIKNLKEAYNALIWRIQNEKSILFYKKILTFLDRIQEQENNGITNKILTRLSQIYNLNQSDARFILDLDYLDYQKFMKDFENFNSKFKMKEEDKNLLIKENSEIGYKGLGRISSSKQGYITSLILNDLERVPDSIQYLSKLNSLEITRSKIGNIPDSLNYLSQVKSLSLKNNEIESIPKWVIRVASKKPYNEKYIKNGVNSKEASILGLLEILTGQAFVKLELNGSFYPSLLFYYKLNNNGNIIAIHLSSDLSRIGIIPKSLCELRYLEELCMVNQNVKKIPDCISQIQTLKTLNLSFNKIRQIPNSIGNLKNLEYFYLRSHKGEQTIDYIPESITNMTKLKEFDLSGTIIKTLPNSIKNLESFKI